jgi:GT2 family glycosyltransferase
MNYIYNIASPLDNDKIILLNNDVIIDDKNSIKKMMSLLKDNVGIVGTKLLYTGTNKLQHAGVVFANHGLPLNYRDGNEDDIVASKNRDFQAVTGALMLMKSDTYKNICKTNKSGVNGLDEECRWMYDDIDACLSISKNQNKKILYCGETKIYHDSSASLKINKVNLLFQNHNINYFLSKWRGKYDLDFIKYSSNTTYGLIK